MALKNPNPVRPGALGTLPDGQYVAVSERIVGEGAMARPARTGTAYLEKITDKYGGVELSYTNRRRETTSQTAGEWLKKYNDVYFNLLEQQPAATALGSIDPHATKAEFAVVEVPNQAATRSIKVTVTVSTQ